MKYLIYLFYFRYDNLYINDGVNGWDQFYGNYPFSGSSIDYIFSPMRTPTNFLYLQFLSDNDINKRGFDIQYEIGIVKKI